MTDKGLTVWKRVGDEFRRGHITIRKCDNKWRVYAHDVPTTHQAANSGRAIQLANQLLKDDKI